MAVSDADLYVIRADAKRKKELGRSQMALRTSTAIEICGEEVLLGEDLQTYKSQPDHQKQMHTSTVDINKILEKIPEDGSYPAMNADPLGAQPKKWNDDTTPPNDPATLPSRDPGPEPVEPNTDPN